MAHGRHLHALAWVSWAAAVVVIGTITRNPFYLFLTVLWIALDTLAVTQSRLEHDMPPVPFSPLRFGALVILLSTLFNGLMVHAGGTVILRLPERLPIIGGPITAEALVYGALNGLVISALFAAFLLVNRAVAVRDLVRLIPRAYYPVAVVVSIAVTFVPTTLRRFQAIREAQAVRGHKIRGIRSWIPLFVPLLTGGVEQALQLSEAMMARGFAGSSSDAEEGNAVLLLRLGLLGGLLAAVSGWLLRLLTGYALGGAALLAAGVLLLGVTLWRAGRRHPHTVYRPQPWRIGDWLVTLAALATMLIFLFGLPGIERQSLFYSPYPTLTAPTFSLAFGFATWGLLAPGAFLAVAALQQQLALRSASSGPEPSGPAKQTPAEGARWAQDA